jgi:alkylation response protein AidB-like acyl-CoA dehydrogenase
VDWQVVISIVAVLATAAVGIAGVITPARTRQADRAYDREAWIREQRAAAYATVLRFVHDYAEILGPKFAAGEPMSEYTREARVQLGLWGSDEVHRLFRDWIAAAPHAYYPGATDEQQRRARGSCCGGSEANS